MDKLTFQVPFQHRKSRYIPLLALLIPLACLSYLSLDFSRTRPSQRLVRVPKNAAQLIDKCVSLNIVPAPPLDFHERNISDRHDPVLAPKKPILIRNATIWTGEVAEGLEIVFGDILLDKGVIRSVGSTGYAISEDVEEININGAWVTPGLVDLHSHIGVNSAPILSGSSDTNSHEGIAQPWLRSLDGLNTYDESYELSRAGGVTTALILPGSDDAIGGQAFNIKLRQTSERSSSSLLLEPPFSTETLNPAYLPGRWRQLKQACGENPSKIYSGTRMDTAWAFRTAYEQARKLKVKQDAFCEKVLAGSWAEIEDEGGEFPDDLQWEALVDVLRGRVKVQNHCYEPTDLDGIVRLTNEFNFSIAAFHHASEAYLVPNLLKKTWGSKPGIALFSTNARKKREAYRASEYAPRILFDEGFDVVLKSDHPITDSRYLIFEAQQAFYYGLNASLALASVTTTPARIAGLDHRVGQVKVGWDADLVIWDSHPLALSSTPLQVFIDGIPQLTTTSNLLYPSSVKTQSVPQTPDWDEEAKEAVAFDGLPPLEPKKEVGLDKGVVLHDVASLYLKKNGRVVEVFNLDSRGATVVIENGTVVCVADVDREIEGLPECTKSQLGKDIHVDLKGGSLSPGLTNYGPPLGLVHISGEKSTQDVGAPGSKAVDGLLFGSRDALLAHHHGATLSITAPVSLSLTPGISTLHSTGSRHKLEKGAVVKDEVAAHVEIRIPNGSNGIGLIRNALEVGNGVWGNIRAGDLPLVVEAHSADIIASLIHLKRNSTNVHVKLVVSGGTEAHLLATELGEAGIGVLVKPSRPFPFLWDGVRLLPGPPLTPKSAIKTLLDANVTVGVGVLSDGRGCWARNLRFDIGWAGIEAGLSRAEALELGSVNVDALFDVVGDGDGDLVATKGGTLLDFGGKVVSVVSSRRGVVELFDII